MNIFDELAYRKYVNKRKALVIDGIEIHAKVEQFEELGAAQERREWKQRAAKIESIAQIMERAGQIAEKDFRKRTEWARVSA